VSTAGGRPGARERVLVWLVASIAVVAFIESFQGLYYAARAGGRPLPWLWPWAVDGFTLAMNVVIWDARSKGRRARWAWWLLICATGVSTALQILHALTPPALAVASPILATAGEADATLRVLTAAWTPIALLLSFERWMWLAYGDQPTASPSRPPAVRAAQPSDHPPATQPTAALDGQAAAGEGGLPAGPPAAPPDAGRQAGGSKSNLPHPARPGGRSPGPVGLAPLPGRADDQALLDRARALNAAHWQAHGRQISRDKLRAALQIGASRAERLLAALTAEPPSRPSAGGPAPVPARAALPARPDRWAALRAAAPASPGGPQGDGRRG
jgi:Protein of unknown function (DUF2637)